MTAPHLTCTLVTYAIAASCYAASPALAAAPKLKTIYTFSKKGEAGYYGGAFLFRDAAGNLYGTTDRGGGKGSGVFFRLTQTGSLSVLYRSNIHQIGGPYILAIDPQGNLYGGNTTGQASSIFKLTPKGKFTTIYDFHTGNVGVGVLLREPDGSFLGSTNTYSGMNALFRLTLAGNFITLLSRSDIAPVDLAEDASGNIFAADSGTMNFEGDVFEYSAEGVFSVLHEFAGPPADGMFPASISIDAEGNLIGVTSAGGKNGATRPVKGYGSVYKLTPQGKEVFDLPMKKNTGRFPGHKLLPDGHGNYISIAGHASRDAPCGAVFKLTPTGHLESVYKFQGHADGCLPNSNLVPDGKGGFYGMTYGNAALATYGTIYHLTL